MSLILWLDGISYGMHPILQLARRYTGGHKGAIACLMTFMAASGEVQIKLFYWTVGMDYGIDYWPFLFLKCR